MTEVRIVCPHCLQRISAPEEVLGREVECPSCSASFMAVAEAVGQPWPPVHVSTPQSGPSGFTSQASAYAGMDEGMVRDATQGEGRQHSLDAKSEQAKGSGFSISGWQVFLVYFAVRAAAPHLFDDYKEVLKFVAFAALAAGGAFFVWKRIISESYIEGGDPRGIRVKSENRSLTLALAATIIITVVVDLIISRNEDVGWLDFFTGEALVLLIGVISFFYFSLLIVRIHNKNMLGRGIKVSADQIPELHELGLKVAERLQINPPQIFVVKGDEINAYALGFKRNYAVVVNSKVVEEMDQEEMAFILGHEFTHIKFRHTLWSTLIGDAGASIPVLSWLLSLPFLKWSRDAEYTCDRGGLVACGSKEAAVSALLLMLGGEKLCRSLSLEDIRKQANELEKGGIFRNPEAFSTHPFIVNRIVKIGTCELIA